MSPLGAFFLPEHDASPNLRLRYLMHVIHLASSLSGSAAFWLQADVGFFEHCQQSGAVQVWYIALLCMEMLPPF